MLEYARLAEGMATGVKSDGVNHEPGTDFTEQMMWEVFVVGGKCIPGRYFGGFAVWFDVDCELLIWHVNKNIE